MQISQQKDSKQEVIAQKFYHLHYFNAWNTNNVFHFNSRLKLSKVKCLEGIESAGTTFSLSFDDVTKFKTFVAPQYGSGYRTTAGVHWKLSVSALVQCLPQHSQHAANVSYICCPKLYLINKQTCRWSLLSSVSWLISFLWDTEKRLMHSTHKYTYT